MSDSPTSMTRVGTAAAAQHLGISPRELKELRRHRRVAFYRIGHRTVSYDVADLDAFLAACRVLPVVKKAGAHGSEGGRGGRVEVSTCGRIGGTA